MYDQHDTSMLSRAQVDQMPGLVLLEFGAEWCHYCADLRPDLARLLREFTKVRHLKIEDGKGKPLGRSFQVKLWPTLLLLRDGVVVARLVRPSSAEVSTALESSAAVTLDGAK